MASRSTYSGVSTPPLSGVDFLNEYSARLKTLFDVSCIPLSAVGGTGNAVTATCDPALTAGFLDGMKFTITWAAANTGAMTLKINGGSAIPVIDADGSAMVASAAISGRRVLLEYLAGSFRVLGGAGGGAGAGPLYQAFTASGTWTKPAGYDANTLVMVEAWGAGGGGARGGSYPQGGSGGAYNRQFFKMGNLASSISVTIGAGGTGATSNGSSGGNGGNSTFGSLMTAYGGGGGSYVSSPPTGGGGGSLSAGSASAAGSLGGGRYNSTPDQWGGAGGGAFLAVGNPAFMGGGSGAGAATSGTKAGGASAFGGAGGASTNGAAGTAGAAPGGGGGAASNGFNGGNGGRGEIRVWVL